MTLRQTIIKVLKEESKSESMLIDYFDKEFKYVRYVHEKEHNSKWISKDRKQLFIRNWWGMLWVTDCGFYNDLRIHAKILGFSTEEFYQILVNYLNYHYKESFKERLLRDVGDEYNCEDLQWG